jgi:hypothetical protein
MLTLLIYYYANGDFSSRWIKTATRRDMAVRYLCANKRLCDTVIHAGLEPDLSGSILASQFGSAMARPPKESLLPFAITPSQSLARGR